MIYLWEHNSIFHKIRPHLDTTEKLSEADIVLVWNDVNPTERAIVRTAKGLGKKTAVFQHGRKGSARYYPPFDEPITADAMLVWGEFDKDRLIKAGHPAKKIRVVGSPVLLDLPESTRENIVFCPDHWDRPVDENSRTRDELRKLGLPVTTKIIESHNPDDFDNPVRSHRDSPEHLDICASVLSKASLVVGVSESTFELMAQAMDIPVVIMEEWEPKAFGGDMRYTEFERLISKGSKRATIETLCQVVQEQLENPDELKRERAEAVISEGGFGQDVIRNLQKLKL